MAPVLEVRDLVTRFHTEQGVVHAVNGISYAIDAGRALAIVGESGSGKSAGVLSVMGLIPPPGVVERGQAFLKGRDLLALPPAERREVLGRDIAMIFQDPATSLNPVLTVGFQVAEGLRQHLDLSADAAERRVVELLNLVGIPDAANRLHGYPHEFSGGQRQRIMIAMALACDPAVLIADEPTTALDVTVQAQIVELVKRLQRQLGMAILWITHDLALVAGLVDEVAVMYAGCIVEQGPVRDIFRAPRHPYTRGLLAAMPRWDADGQERLVAIEGSPPDLRQPLAHCPFAPRCPAAADRCRQDNPGLAAVNAEHRVACWRWEDLA
ncbi:MAG: ABC transporter ATP-binding protein [Gemmatimonadota bacterium]|nr:ABC transporter ATP-binding protein [Gemmatimonadota bacterium]